MSFVRLIYLSSLIGGWAAFIGWLFTELLFGRYIDRSSVSALVQNLLAVLMATLVSIPIGGGISSASELSNFQFPSLLKRLVVGFVGGLLGGLVGGLFGVVIFAITERIPIPFLSVLGRVLGWTIIGVGIGVGLGVVEGFVERSLKKLRNGLIGGVIGGFLGGFFFLPVNWVVGSPMSSRAVGFVLLGLSIGLFIGLAQVVLKEAWLTVEQGFRPGRQMILGKDVVTMGTSEKATLIFIAYGAKGVEPIHLRIAKSADGRFVLEDNRSRTGTFVNGVPVTGPTLLRDGDAIQLGVNVVRFRERVTHGVAGTVPPPSTPAQFPSTAVSAQPVSPAPMPAKPVPSAAIQTIPMPVKPAAVQPATVPVVKPAPPVVKPATVPVVKPAPPVAAKPAPAPTPVPPMGIPPKPAVPPAPAPVKPAAPAPAATAQEGRCPICDKKIVGIPGKRRCDSCFTTF